MHLRIRTSQFAAQRQLGSMTARWFEALFATVNQLFDDLKSKPFDGARRGPGVYPREIPATRDRVGSDRWRRWRGRRGGRARKGEPAHSSATTATRSSITCAALIGVDPVAGEASVQPGAARPVAS